MVMRELTRQERLDEVYHYFIRHFKKFRCAPTVKKVATVLRASDYMVYDLIAELVAMGTLTKDNASYAHLTAKDMYKALDEVTNRRAPYKTLDGKSDDLLWFIDLEVQRTGLPVPMSTIGTKYSLYKEAQRYVDILIESRAVIKTNRGIVPQNHAYLNALRKYLDRKDDE